MIELFLPDYPGDVETLLQDHAAEIHAEETEIELQEFEEQKQVKLYNEKRMADFDLGRQDELEEK